MMIYIVHRDVAHEFGQVMGVCTKKATALALCTKLRREHPTDDDTDWCVEIWDTTSHEGDFIEVLPWSAE